jgi:hypothetical protein
VGVYIDPPRTYEPVFGVDFSLCRARHLAYGADAVSVHRDITHETVATGAIENGAISYDEVVH